MNVDHDASLGVNGKALRLNLAVDFVELSGPIGPNLVVAHRPRPVDRVGPVDIFMKSGQRRVARLAGCTPGGVPTGQTDELVQQRFPV